MSKFPLHALTIGHQECAARGPIVLLNNRLCSARTGQYAGNYSDEDTLKREYWAA